ncbi:MAG: DUF447 family protein [Methanosarcinaceae archaeon]|nr:DUF447 family protein [Methanosarcinaceae archaeon]
MTTIDLDDFGIGEGISETVVTTYNGWNPNAAPIGIMRKNDKVYVRLFRGSNTYRNVLENQLLVANVVYDPILIVKSTLHHLDNSDFNIVSYDKHGLAVLKGALSWVAFECINIKKTSEALVAEIIPLHAHVNQCRIKAPNRGFNLIIESAIHATRYKLTNDEKYLKLIRAYRNTIVKCGAEPEREAIDLLMEQLTKK